MKTKLLFLILLSLCAGSLRAAEAEIISAANICTEYNANGSVNTGGFSGGDGMANLFDGNFDGGVHFGRSGDGSYFVLDFTSKLAGGYFITDIKIGLAASFAYSVYFSTNGTASWTAVAGATNVTQIGTSTFGVNDVATHVKVVMDKSPGWGAGLSEIEVWGLDPADVGCRHPSYTEWEEVPGSATCTTYGFARRKCTVCGEVFERDVTLPLGHAWEAHLATPGTSSAYGSGTLVCSRCGESIVFNVPLDLTLEGGIAVPGRVQFTDLTVSSTGDTGYGVNHGNLIDGIWDMSWCNYWYASTTSNDEWARFDFAAEIDLTKIDISVPNRNHTVRFLRPAGDGWEEFGTLPVSKSGDAEFLRTAVEFRGVTLRALRIQTDDPGNRMLLCEVHPYGTVLGAGKLDVLRTRILLY